MNRHQLFFRASRAFSLIEAAIVLGVIGLVIGGIWAAAAAVNENRKWADTEAGWLYYVQEINRQFNGSNTPTSDTDIHAWFEAAVTPPSGWTGKRNDPNNSNTYHPSDPYGNQLYAQIKKMSGVPVVYLAYNWQTLPLALCAKTYMLIYKVNKTNPIRYMAIVPGCSPAPDKTIDYYLNSSCCPGSPRAYFDLPY